MSKGLVQLEQKIAASRDHLERIRAQHALAEELVASEPLRALALCQDALEAATLHGAQAEQAESLYLLGHAEMTLSHYAQALERAQDAQALATRLGDLRLQADCLQLTGIIHDGLGAYDEALHAFLQALRLRQESGDSMGQAKTLNSIGIIYAKWGDQATALEYYERSYALHNELGDESGATIALNNLGAVRKNLGDYEEALEAFSSSLAAFRKLGNERGEAGALSNLGMTYGMLGRDSEALAAYRQSLELLEHADNKLSQAEVLRNFGELLDRLGCEDEAEEALRRALMLAEEIGAKMQHFKAHQALAAFYKARGDFGAALEHFEHYHRMEREVYADSSEEKLKQMQLAFELEQAEKEREIFRLKHVELSKAHDELQELTVKLAQQNFEDALTGLNNRRYLDIRLAEEFRRARRHGHALSVAICDLDSFKRINDRMSHAIGDETLRMVARVIRDNVREEDIVARYGGEEFVMAFLETSAEQAAVACEKVRRAVELYPWQDIHPRLKVTISIGLCGDLSLENHEKMLAAADARLYRAKKAGKNQVCA